MKRRHVFVFLISFSTLMFSLLILTRDSKVIENPFQNISIITGGKINEGRENMKQGAEQAGTDMNANISFISLGEENSVEEQKRLLTREVQGGADAILISPVDYEEMKKELEEVKDKMPVILIESGNGIDEDYGYISCDDAAVGSDLADEVMRHGNTRKKIGGIDSSNTSSMNERKKSFETVIKNSKNQYINIEIEKEGYKGILRWLMEEDLDVIVAFSTNMLEEAVKAVKKYEELGNQKKVEVYGIGSSSDVISYLESDYIISMVVQDDFSIGYLGVKNAVNALKGKKMDCNNKITYAIIDHEHMYSEKNQRLLFPFIR